jgi:hypothetical protein
MCFGMLAYSTYKGGGGSMFTCRDLGCEYGNRCIRRHSGGQSRHLLMMFYDVTDFIFILIFIERVYIFLFLSMYSYCSSMYYSRCLYILIVVYVRVFLLFIHVFLTLSIYSHCCPCILIVVYVYLLLSTYS